MSLMKRMLKNKHLSEDVAILSKSKIMNRGGLFSSEVYLLNAALSGSIHGKMRSGILELVGDSKTFKTGFMLTLMKAFQDEYKDGVVLFFDSEGGASRDYFETFGIDEDRVLHVPIVDIENLTVQTKNLLEELKRDDIEAGERVFVAIDSVGLLPSKKEAENALTANEAQDLTRARAMNSFWRILLPMVNLKGIPVVAINHSYQNITGNNKEQIVKGGKNSTLAVNDIWIIGKSVIKDGKELIGHTFNVRIHKSRSVKEKAFFPIEINYGQGFDRYTGLLDLAVTGGFVVKPKNGWFTRPNIEGDKSWRRAQTSCSEFWQPILEDEKFDKFIYDTYSLATGEIFDGEKTVELADGTTVDVTTGEVK